LLNRIPIIVTNPHNYIMAKFLSGNELNSELEKILLNASDEIILISPYIKLHERYIRALRPHKENPKLKITIVFGKNEEDISKSMGLMDFNFFKEFPNINIRYEKSLHAKYYANESIGILTSMNLHSYSQDNNVEAGVMTNFSFLGNIANKMWSGESSLDSQTFNFFLQVIELSEPLFTKTPQYENGFLGITSKYKNSTVELDNLTEFFNDRNKYEKAKITVTKESTNLAISPISKGKIKTGYCIRTGIEIPFNIEKPLSYDAYKEWNKQGNKDSIEKFCHFSGEASNGETSVSKPILKKNWSKAKTEFSLK
jgi:hypothetical protein